MNSVPVITIWNEVEQKFGVMKNVVAEWQSHWKFIMGDLSCVTSIVNSLWICRVIISGSRIGTSRCDGFYVLYSYGSNDKLTDSSA